jgi:hypothetical protein
VVVFQANQIFKQVPEMKRRSSLLLEADQSDQNQALQMGLKWLGSITRYDNLVLL